MATTAAPFDASARSRRTRHARRTVTNRLMLGLATAATLVALVPLVLILSYVVYKGAGALSADFFTQSFKPIQIGQQGTSASGGVLNAIVGSLIIVAVALALAVPVGVLAGIFLAEYPGTAASTVIRFCADVLTAMPSIVVGVVAYTLIVQRAKHFSGWAGSVALLVLMVPVITRTTEEILRLVPGGVREAAMALGVPKWRYTLGVVIPMGLGGIVTGILLAFARASGETAPLLVTVLGNNNLSYNLFAPMAALPLIAYRYSGQPYPALIEQAWGAALLLVVFVLTVNLLVRFATRGRR